MCDATAVRMDTVSRKQYGALQEEAMPKHILRPHGIFRQPQSLPRMSTVLLIHPQTHLRLLSEVVIKVQTTSDKGKRHARVVASRSFTDSGGCNSMSQGPGSMKYLPHDRAGHMWPHETLLQSPEIPRVVSTRTASHTSGNAKEIPYPFLVMQEFPVSQRKVQSFMTKMT